MGLIKAWDQGGMRDGLTLVDRAIAIARSTGAGNLARYLDERAAILKHMGRMTDALAASSESIILANPPSARGLINHASILCRVGKLDQALERARLGIGIDPIAQGFAVESEILLRMGRMEEALDSIDKAIRLQIDPLAINFRIKADILHRIELRREVPRMAGLSTALECNDMALKLRGDQYKSHLQRGEILSDLGDYPAAIRAFETAKGFMQQPKGKFSSSAPGCTGP